MGQMIGILQMNLGRVGGILEAKKISGLAEAHYAQIAPHLYCGPIVGAANNQLENPSIGEFLLKNKIVYSPDYLVNSGGVIAIACEINNSFCLN